MSFINARSITSVVRTRSLADFLRIQFLCQLPQLGLGPADRVRPTRGDRPVCLLKQFCHVTHGPPRRNSAMKGCAIPRFPLPPTTMRWREG